CRRRCSTKTGLRPGPPFSPLAPLALSRIRCPSLTPAGIRTCIVWLEAARPDPLQYGHGSSTTRPRPRQLLHGSVIANTPPVALVCIPLPSHLPQTFRTVPARAPVPWHCGHASSLVIRSGTVTPSTAR